MRTIGGGGGGGAIALFEGKPTPRGGVIVGQCDRVIARKGCDLFICLQCCWLLHVLCFYFQFSICKVLGGLGVLFIL